MGFKKDTTILRNRGKALQEVPRKEARFQCRKENLSWHKILEHVLNDPEARPGIEAPLRWAKSALAERAPRGKAVNQDGWCFVRGGRQQT